MHNVFGLNKTTLADFRLYADGIQFLILQTAFDGLIDTFLENNIGIAEHFLKSSMAADLKENLTGLYAHHQLRSAGIGNDVIVAHDTRTRSDKIYWLDRSHNDAHENEFFDMMDEFVLYLNSTCYTGITGYEFHYTLYEAGSFYKRHLDQFRSDKSRAYSMIMYLNTAWMPGDGGELCIHHNKHKQTISPLNGTCVFFKSSEIEHEVLVTLKPRLSITGWLKTN